MTTDDTAVEQPTRRGGWQRWKVPVLVGGTAMVVAVTGAGVSWAQQADLRDLPSLERVDGVVVGEDRRRGAADLVEVRYPVDGTDVTASIPSEEYWEEGRAVEVAYVAGDPARVRLVDGWTPPWEQWLLFAVLAPVVSLVSGLRHRTTDGARRAGASLRRRRRA